jgi:hypothetical protein
MGRVFRSRIKDGSAFHGAIADIEPDGWARQVILRDRANRRRDAKEHSEGLPNSLDDLLAVDDFSRIGALRFKDERDMERLLDAVQLIEQGLGIRARSRLFAARRRDRSARNEATVRAEELVQ